MELFPRKPRTILDELTDLENMMPNYEDELLNVSKFIRRNVWGQIDDRILLETLRVFNTLYSLAVDAIGQDFEIISEYVVQFSRIMSEYANLNIEGAAQMLLEKLWQDRVQKTVLNQWIQLDPSRRNEFDESELYRKISYKSWTSFGILCHQKQKQHFAIHSNPIQNLFVGAKKQEHKQSNWQHLRLKSSKSSISLIGGHRQGNAIFTLLTPVIHRRILRKFAWKKCGFLIRRLMLRSLILRCVLTLRII